MVQGSEKRDREEGDNKETESQRRKWHSDLPERSGRRRDVLCLRRTITTENGSGRNPGVVTHNTLLWSKNNKRMPELGIFLAISFSCAMQSPREGSVLEQVIQIRDGLARRTGNKSPAERKTG